MRCTEISLSEWEALLPRLPGGGPYASTCWGRLVSASFGGEFRVFRLEAGEALRYAPVLVGGQLAGDGFCSGHVGYGGVYDMERGAALPLHAQCEALSVLEQQLGLRCRRLVAPPGVPGEATIGQERTTVVVPLPEAPSALWAQYSGNARNTLRRAERCGLRVSPLGPEHTREVTELIHLTQERVGAPYRSPPSLIEGLLRQGEHFTLAVGSWLDSTLVGTSIFLRTGGQVTYLFNGWRREHAQRSPNYLLVHAALQQCTAWGDRAVDLGFSHEQALLAFKLRWGGQRTTFRVAEFPTRAPATSGAIHER